MALALGAATSASADVYVFDIFAASFVPPIGTVTVTGDGTSSVGFNVQLADGFYFQQTGNGGIHDAFWFDLLSSTTNQLVNYNITAPDGSASGTGDFPTDGLFAGAQYSATGAYGQGFLSGFHYAVQVSDASAGQSLDYYHSPLTFTVTSQNGSNLTLLSQVVSPSPGVSATVYGGADLRQCSTTDAQVNCIATGPVGFRLSDNNNNNNVPEPASWALMITGFGGVGALMRRRRRHAYAYA